MYNVRGTCKHGRDIDVIETEARRVETLKSEGQNEERDGRPRVAAAEADDHEKRCWKNQA